MNGTARAAKVLGYSTEAVEYQGKLENLAAKEIAAELPLLHAAASVLIWGALEAAFRDFLVRWLVAYPIARTVQELNNIRIKVAEYERLEGEDRMRYLVGLLERELAVALKPGVGRFDCMLKPFGINPRISDEQRRDLNELAAIRNAIVHRAGIADDRLIQLCPWLKFEIGEPVLIGRATFLRYVDATSAYAASLVESAEAVGRSFGSAENLN